MFICIVDHVGRIIVHIMIVFIYSLAPSMPQNLTVTINNSTSVNLTWEKPEMRNGMIRSYTILVLNASNMVVHNQTVTDSPYVITELTANTNYTVNVTAFTVRSGVAASETFTTPACKHIFIMLLHCMIIILHQCPQFH